MTAHPVAEPPADLLGQWPAAAESNFLLVLGNDYLHKNRDLAIRIWHELASRSGIDLVLAGLHVGERSTRVREDELLSSLTPCASSVVRLGHVSSAARSWLMGNAQVVLYPSSAEGFGLVPHEAAAMGVPSMSTAFGPMRESLPETALASGWDVSDYVDRLEPLLAEKSAGSQQVKQILASHPTLTWEAGAGQLAEAFRKALRMPPRNGGPSGIDTVEAFRTAARLESLRARASRKREFLKQRGARRLSPIRRHP